MASFLGINYAREDSNSCKKKIVLDEAVLPAMTRAISND